MHVVIPTHARSALLARTLNSLAECVLPEEYQRTFVIENGGHRGARKVCTGVASHLRVKYMYQNENNKSRALNRVLDAIGEGIVVMLDDDVRIATNALVEYAATAKRSGEGVFFGGPMDVDYEQEPPEWLKEYLPWSAVGWELSPETEFVSEPVFLGCNWAAFAQDLRAAGGHDCRLGPGGTSGGVGQDTRMQEALLANGARGQYVPNARVWHYVPRERCSPAWALHRVYRTSIRDGLVTEDPSRRWFGVPRWMFKELARRYILARLSGFSKTSASSFAKLAEYWRLRGRIRGCRLANNKQRENAPLDHEASQTHCG
jgi:GT2 family glycosyltransferase